MNRNLKLAAIVWGLAVLALAGSVMADGFLKQVSHTDAVEIMGQKVPAQDDTTVMWLGPDRAANFIGDSATIIIIPAEGTVLMIDHKVKQYSKVPADMGSMMDKALKEAGGGLDEEGAAEAKAMMQAMLSQAKVSVEPTSEAKQIGSWQAKKYLVSYTMAMAAFNLEVWATEDIKIDQKLYQDLTGRMLSRMPGMEKMAEEMKKIQGVVVLSTSTVQMMGSAVKSETRLVEFAEKTAPAGTYAVPAGYTEVPFSSSAE